MTAAEFNAATNASILARREQERLLPCVCGAIDIDVETSLTGSTWIDCIECDRGVGAPTKADTIKLWNAAMRHDSIEAERAAWMKEAAMLLAALKYVVDIFHDDPESGQSMQHAAIEQAQDAIERATA